MAWRPRCAERETTGEGKEEEAEGGEEEEGREN